MVSFKTLKNIKYNKLKSQFGELETSDLSEDVSIFINTCSYESNFYKKLLKFSKLIIIDVAAKGSMTNIDKKVNLMIFLQGWLMKYHFILKETSTNIILEEKKIKIIIMLFLEVILASEMI